LVMLPPPPRSPLFPYTTLFRSEVCLHLLAGLAINLARAFKQGDSFAQFAVLAFERTKLDLASLAFAFRVGGVKARAQASELEGRSEEHTSELQSRENLVCRLLL